MKSPKSSRMSGWIVAACIGLVACSASGSGTITPNPVPTATPTAMPTPSAGPSASPSASATPVPTPSATVAPTPTPTPAANYTYDLPLVGAARPECQGKDQVIYDVQADGTFKYYPGTYNPFGDEPVKPLQQRQLTATELQDLRTLVNEANLAKKFESSVPVPPGSPQTTECRTVLEFTLQVNGGAQTYDANGRRFTHSQEYRDAIERIRQRLQDLSGIAPNS